MRHINRLPLIEPVPIDDDLCSGLAMIEPLWSGTGVRLVFFSEQTCYEANCSTNVVKSKIVLPIEQLETMSSLLLRHIASLRVRAAG